MFNSAVECQINKGLRCASPNSDVGAFINSMISADTYMVLLKSGVLFD